MRPKRVAAVAALLVPVALVLPLLVGCGKSSASSSPSAKSPAPVSECYAAVSMQSGRHFTVTVIATADGVPKKPSLTVWLGKAKMPGAAGVSLSLNRITAYPVLQTGPRLSALAQNGRAILTPKLGPGGWTVSGSRILIHVRVAVVAKNRAGNSDGDGAGECDESLSLPRIIKKVVYCLRSVFTKAEKVIKLVIQLTEKEHGWTYELVEASIRDLLITVDGRQVPIFETLDLRVQERVSHGGLLSHGTLNDPLPFEPDLESDILPAGSTLFINGEVRARGRTIPCRVSPPITLGEDLP